MKSAADLHWDNADDAAANDDNPFVCVRHAIEALKESPADDGNSLAIQRLERLLAEWDIESDD